MELVYLWVKDYKNIHNQGFNFSPKFHCEYDKDTNELTIDENDDYIENFFGDNINVTAIVGKNGSGKSSVLEYLSDSPKFVVSFENDVFHISEDIKIINRTRYKFIKKVVDLNCIYIPSSDYLINNLSKFGGRSLENDNNNSLNFIFKEDDDRGGSQALNNDKLVHNQFQIFLNAKNTSHIKFPKNIIISAYNLDHLVHFDSDFDKWINISQESILLSDYIYIFALSSICDNLNTNEVDYIMELDSLLNKYIQLNKKNHIYKKLFFYLQERITNKSELELFTNMEKLCKLFRNLNIESDSYCTFTIPLEEFPKEAFNIDTGIKKNEVYINFSYEWDIRLSSGEFNMINSFSIVYFELNNNSNLIYLLIDEGESFLHPNWQKKYISYIVKFIKDNFPNRKIHIILTSHSPFLLSDIPKQNIIFLDKDKEGNCKVVDGLKDKKQTFGANIHTLLSDSFFMEHGLMGEFAKSKIDKAITLLNQNSLDEKELKYCEQIISIIGEPIVKNQLQRMLDSKRLKKIDEIDIIKQNMVEMQKRLDELEK